MPKVSVIVPTYNRANTLERALNSVAQQTMEDWELLIVDDGSTDHTSNLVAEWTARQPQPERVRSYKTENRGVSAARNLAAHHATSEWIAFLDSDDEWLPHKLESQLKLTDRFSLIHAEEIWVRNGKRVNPMKKHAKSGGRIFTRCVEITCVSPSTTMLNRRKFLELEGFREDFPVCEDYELWLRWLRTEDAGFVADPVIIKHGGHEDQLSLTHRGMDLYRAKALRPFLYDSKISHEERDFVATTLIEKCEILINGFRKHQNFTHLREIENCLAEARGYLLATRRAFTQSQMAHSAAERRPLSEATVNL